MRLLVTTVFYSLLRALTIQYFWAWYVVSVFHSLPTLTLLQAMGFSLFVSLMNPFSVSDREVLKKKIDVKETTKEKFLGEFLSILFYALIWAMAGILHVLILLFGRP